MSGELVLVECVKAPSRAGDKAPVAVLSDIDKSILIGLRDQLIIKTLAYTGARVGSVAGLERSHYYEAPDQWMLHSDEKQGKSREIPVVHDLKALFDAYLERTGIKDVRREKDPITGEWRPIYLTRTASGRTPSNSQRDE